jgi:hypothetical protein
MQYGFQFHVNSTTTSIPKLRLLPVLKRLVLRLWSTGPDLSNPGYGTNPIIPGRAVSIKAATRKVL